mgnify:CR=1 FL=1
MKNITHFKVGDLVSMPSTEFLKLAKLGLILKSPVYGRTVEWSKAYNNYIVHERNGTTYKLKPDTSVFLKDLDRNIKFEVVRPVKGIILKRKPI